MFSKSRVVDIAFEVFVALFVIGFIIMGAGALIMVEAVLLVGELLIGVGLVGVVGAVSASM